MKCEFPFSFKNGRIIARLRWEGTSRSHLVQSPVQARPLRAAGPGPCPVEVLNSSKDGDPIASLGKL